MRDVRDDTRAYRIGNEDCDRNRRGRSFCCERLLSAQGDDDIGTKLDQLGSKDVNRCPPASTNRYSNLRF